MPPRVCLFTALLALLAPGLLCAQGFDNVDFDRNGEVAFDDFIAFSSRFGSQQGDAAYAPTYDVNLDGRISFEDFLIFAQYYGKKRSTATGALKALLIGVKIRMAAEDTTSFPVDPFLGQLLDGADRSDLQQIAGDDAQLSLDEVKLALGDPVLADALTALLENARTRMTLSGVASLPVDPLLENLPVEADRAELLQIAGDDAQLSLDEIKTALGDLPLSSAVADALEAAKLKATAAGAPVDIAGLLDALADDADKDLLLAIAGDDGLLSADEARAALGDPLPSSAVANALNGAKAQMAVQGITSVPVAPFLETLADDADRNALEAIAGDDAQLSLDEVKAALGDPILSDALADALEDIALKAKTAGAPVSIANLLAALTDPADREILTAIAGDDGLLSLDESKAALGDPVLSNVVAAALNQAKLQMAAGGVSAVTIDAILAGVSEDADRNTLKAIAGDDGLLSLNEVKAALGDPVLSSALAAALETAQFQVKAAGGAPVDISDLLDALADSADSAMLRSVAGEDGLLSLDESKIALGDPVLTDAVAAALNQAKIQMAVGGTAQVDVAALLEGLSDADRNALLAAAGDDGLLSLNESKAALGDPILSTAAADVLEKAKMQVKIAGGAPVPVDDLLASLTDDADKEALKTIAGDDGLLSLGEAKAALGDPLLSDAVSDALDQINLQLKSGVGAPVAVAPYLEGLASDADVAALKAFAGDDGELSPAEMAAVQGDPVLSNAVADALDMANMQIKAAAGAPVVVDSLLNELTNEADKEALRAFAGDDGLISSAEAAAALGNPVLSNAVAAVLDEIKMQMKINGDMPVSVDDYLDELTDGADKAALNALAGSDGKLSSEETAAALGDPVLSDAVADVLDKIKSKIKDGDGAPVSIDAFLDELTSQADKDALRAFAGSDGELSSAEAAAAKGNPVLSDAVIGVLEKIKFRLRAGGDTLPVAAYLDSLSDEADKQILQTLAGKDGRMSQVEARAALGEPVVYTISGQIVDALGAGLLGVMVSLQGDARVALIKGDSVFIAVTGEDGAYSFENFPDGPYTLTPSAWRTLFTPPVQGVRVQGRDVQVASFQASPAPGKTYAISGRVTDLESGRGLQGVSVALVGGSADATDTTDAKGNYRFEGLPDDSTYTVTPSAFGFRFSPESQSVTLNEKDVETARFQGKRLELPPVEESIVADLAGGITMEMVWIEAGEFKMGARDDEGGRFDREGPQHDVKITQGFYLCKYEITQAQWESIMKTAPWQGQPYVNAWDRASPATYVSWYDAQAFVDNLNQRGGKTAYRLPTEAEWEYAGRAGTEFDWHFGTSEQILGEYAWYDVNAWNAGGRYAHRVGGKFPNPWGLYDIHGNVYEWVQDWSGPYTVGTDGRGEGDGPVEDPAGPSASNAQPPARVIRSGSFASIARLTRSAFRSALPPTTRTYTTGFRVVKTLPPEEGPVIPPGPGPSAQPRRISGRVLTRHYFLPGGVFLIGDRFIALPLGWLFPRTPVHRDSVKSFRSRGIPVITDTKGIGGVTVGASRRGIQTGAATSDGGGNYVISNLPEDLYEVVPARGGYSFSPDAVDVELFGGNSGRNFEGREAGAISGRVAEGGSGLPDVWLHLKGERVASSRTNASGNYRFSNLPKGAYTITPAREGYTFSPHVLTVRMTDKKEGSKFVVQDKANQNILAMRDTVRAAGENVLVTLPGGVPLDMVWIEPGTFKMGASEEDPDRYDQEQPQREVRISKGVYMGKFEITQEQWWRVMGSRPWEGQPFVYPDSLDHPAVYISWDDVQGFVRELNNSETDPDIRYRLPTEAEWEYACRAGTKDRWSHGGDELQLKNYAWYEFNAWKQGRKRPESVGAKQPNPWGLYDMHGNVYEWVQDWFGPYTAPVPGRGETPGPVVDPVLSDAAKTFDPPRRVIRGGSFSSIARTVRSAFRTGLPTSEKSTQVGFRIVMEDLNPIPRFKRAHTDRPVFPIDN